MRHGLDYARYEHYLATAAAELHAEGPFSVRRLSPSQWEEVAHAAARDRGLRRRWRERLALGYYAEKSRLADEIEKIFAGIPDEEESVAPCEDAA